MEKKQSILLSISGKKRVEVQFAEVDISSLKLGLFNPRFRHKSLKSEDEVEKDKKDWILEKNKKFFIGNLFEERFFCKENNDKDQ